MANEPFFTANGNYQAAEFRRLLSTFYTVTAPGGIIGGMVVTGGGGSNVSIAPGSVVINDSTNGVYVADSTSASTVAIGSYAGSARVDTVYVFVSETTGTELSVGVAVNSSTVPSLAIPLAHVSVTDASPIGSATNPIVMVANQAELTLVKNRYQPLANVPWTSPSPGSGAFTNGGAPDYYTFAPADKVQYYGPQFSVTNGIVYVRGNVGNVGGGGSGAYLLKLPTKYAPRDNIVLMVPCTAQFGWDEDLGNGQIVTGVSNFEFFDLVEIVGQTPNFGDPRAPGGLYHFGKVLGADLQFLPLSNVHIVTNKTYFINTSWSLQL